jgi:hypothetical protein
VPQVVGQNEDDVRLLLAGRQRGRQVVGQRQRGKRLKNAAAVLLVML